MSMTLIAFVQKANIPSSIELKTEIDKLSYDFSFIKQFDEIERFSGVCKLNGIETFFELYTEEKSKIIQELPSLNEDLKEYDYGISFISGSDYIANACIGIISIALMDICNSKVLYADDEIWYTREMFLEEIPLFLEEHNKESKLNKVSSFKKAKNRKSQYITWLLWGLAIISGILLKREIISWPIAAFILVLLVVKSIVDERKKRKF